MKFAILAANAAAGFIAPMASAEDAVAPAVKPAAAAAAPAVAAIARAPTANAMLPTTRASPDQAEAPLRRLSPLAKRHGNTR